MRTWVYVETQLFQMPCQGNTTDINLPGILASSNDDVVKCKQFPCYWPFVRGIHWSPVNSPHKGQRCGALMFSLICAWTNGWANHRDIGDLRRHHTHYDVTVMTNHDIEYTCQTCLIIHCLIVDIIHWEGLQLPRWSRCLELIEKANHDIFFPIVNSAREGIGFGLGIKPG